MAGIKSPAAEFGANTNSWPGLIAQASGAAPAVSEIAVTMVGKYGSVAPTIGGTYPAGTITYNFSTGRASGTAAGIVTADGGGGWTCNNATATTVLSKYRPQACR
ncbi:pilin [Methyloradius palustris]|uniref:pilin n=1 Tax=Methyloradius palustris TaxID=2778876 RepID=UPI00384E220E